MNLQLFAVFIWLRWRLFLNQMRRGGIANIVILILVFAGAVIASIFLFVLAVIVGSTILGDAKASILMYVWDGLVVAFLVFWGSGILTELQRSEALSLQKFLHLPVSLSGVFALNYLSSYFSMSMAIFAPAMIGLCVGLAFSRGPVMLLLLPMVIAFLVMVTALTYQFQGWLASLMVNQRRRRTIVVLVTFFAVLSCQLPNLINVLRPWDEKKGLTHEESQQALALLEQSVEWANLLAPPGWLPYSARGLAEGNVLPLALGFGGLMLIGSASLWRAYRTTLRLYTGVYTAGQKQPAVTVAAKKTRPPTQWLDRDLPWVPEQAAAIALASFRSLTRAPEAKMLLLPPIIFFVIFGGMFWRGANEFPDALRPALAFLAINVTLFTMAQLLANQFGFDRNGFRVYVLSAAPRREILLGKNLSVVPLAFTLSLIACVVVQVFAPMRFDRFVALLPQFVSMYLLFCLMANGLSIFVPMPMAAGTLKPTNTKAIPILVTMVFMMFSPMLMAPLLIPLGIELAVEELSDIRGIPICLILSVAVSAAVLWLYRRLLTWEGDWLQARERTILETVTTKTE